MTTDRLFGQKLNLSQISGLLAATLALITGLIISLLTWSHLHDQLSLRLQQDAQRQLQRLTVAIAPSLLLQDRVSISVTLQEWVRGPELDAIRVLNNNQQIIAETGRAGANSFELSQPVTQDNVSIGILRAYLNLEPIRQTAGRYLALGIIITAFCALLCGLAVLALAERYLKYIRQLQQQLQHWQQDTSALLELPASPALGELQELHQTLSALARQQHQQQAIQQALARFSAGSAPAASTRLQYHDCAMLFIEIEDLDSLQASLSAEELTHNLNRYYRLLTQAAKLYNGKLDRYIGNGAVMLFGMSGNHSSEERNHHALHCLYAAQLFLGLIRNCRPEPQTPCIRFRLAAHWGPVLLAPLSADKSTTHCDLIGDTLHWAAHLAHHSQNQELLVSATLHAEIQPQEDLHWQDGPDLTDLHGRPQQNYWLQQLPEKQQSLISRQIRHITAMTATSE